MDTALADGTNLDLKEKIIIKRRNIFYGYDMTNRVVLRIVYLQFNHV